MLNLIRKANEVMAVLNNENRASLALELYDQVDAMWQSRAEALEPRQTEFVTTVNGLVAQFDTADVTVISAKLNDAVDKYWRTK